MRNTKVLVLMLVLLAFLGGCATTAPQPSPDQVSSQDQVSRKVQKEEAKDIQLFNQGAEFLKSKKFDKALQSFIGAYSLNKKREYALMAGWSLIQMRRFLRAMPWLEKAAQGDDAVSARAQELMKRYKVQADLQWAPSTLDEAERVSKDNNKVRALNALKWLYAHHFNEWERGIGGIDAVRLVAQRIIKFMPHRPLAYRLMGNTYMKVGDFQQADVWYRKALEKGKDMSSLRARMQILRILQGPVHQQAQPQKKGGDM